MSSRKLSGACHTCRGEVVLTSLSGMLSAPCSCTCGSGAAPCRRANRCAQHAGGQAAPLGPSHSEKGLRLVWPTMEQVRRQPAPMAGKGVWSQAPGAHAISADAAVGSSWCHYRCSAIAPNQAEAAWQVRQSNQGWAAGGSLPGKDAYVHHDELLPRWARWGGEASGRARAMPHIKTYTRFTCARAGSGRGAMRSFCVGHTGLCACNHAICYGSQLLKWTGCALQCRACLGM